MATKASAKSKKSQPRKESAPAARSSAPASAAPVASGSRSEGSKRRIRVAAPAPVEAPTKARSFEERWAVFNERLKTAGPDFVRRYLESVDMSWIYHDSAIEGSVYTPFELRTAFDQMAGLGAIDANAGPAGSAMSNGPSAVAPAGGSPLNESSLQPICEEIRRNREALEHVRELGANKRIPITVDTVRKIYLILHPEEGDLKSVKYRKDIPQHRLYFHEYAQPEKIASKLRQVIESTNDPETQKGRSPLRLAARAHYDMLRVFPFTHDSGKVARMFMNILLLRSGLPPAIVHSTERQRYYEALRGQSAAMTQIVQESIENHLASVEKLLETHMSKGYTVRI